MIKKLLLIIVTLTVMAWLFAWPYPVAGDCMEPAVKDGSYAFVNRMLPYFRAYKIGDIAVFDHEQKAWIARIVALENDVIQISDGTILVNGIVLQDSVKRNWKDWKYGSYGIEQPLTVPIGHVYVLSDDLSAHHDDSRVFGPISEKYIEGLVWQ